MTDWDAVVFAKWQSRSTLFDFLNFLPRHIVLRFIDYYKGMSPTFICFLLVIDFADGHFLIRTCLWNEPLLDTLLSFMLVYNMGNNYAVYSLMYPEIHHIVPPRVQRITLNLSSFLTVLSAKLPHIISFVDLELRPSLFNLRGLVSFIICFLTEADIYLFHWSPGCLLTFLRLDLYPLLFFQSCLRFLVFLCMIVFGGSNMIVKAWLGDLDFHKHVLFLLILCACSYIRFHEKYCRLRRMMKKLMVVVPIDERDG